MDWPTAFAIGCVAASGAAVVIVAMIASSAKKATHADD